MTHAEFHSAVKAIAAGKYFSCQVTTREHTQAAAPSVEFAAYIEGPIGWTTSWPTAEAVLTELTRSTRVDSLGDVASEVAR